MQQNEVLRMFEDRRALLAGHFKLSGGLHSEKYLQCALVLQHADMTDRISSALAGKFKDQDINVVIGPALGGVVLAHRVAGFLGARGIFSERTSSAENLTGNNTKTVEAMALRRGFVICPGERVLVVEDVVTTGGSTMEVISLVKNSGGIVVGVGSIINRNSGEVDFGVEYKYLLKLDINTFTRENCPLCKAGIPVVKPGSRK